MSAEDWKWLLSAIIIAGAIWRDNGAWLLVLFLVWGSS